MSDFNSSLPVRTQNPGDVASIIVDATTPSQGMNVDASGRLTIKLDDGTGNAITSQANGAQRALDVGINVAGVQIDPRQIRALTAADVVTANIKDSAGLSINLGQQLMAASLPVVIASNQSTLQTKDQADGPVAPGTVAANSILIGGQFNTVLPTLATGQQSALQSDASGRLLIGSIASPLPAGTNNIGKTSIQDSSGNPIISTNPLYVTVVPNGAGITEVNDYNTATALAAAATSNHDYTITATKTFKGRMIWASASGKLKIEVQVSPDGVAFATKWVGFNSTANPNISIQLDQLTFSDTGTGAVIRVIRTNTDLQSQNVYSTISGQEF